MSSVVRQVQFVGGGLRLTFGFSTVGSQWISSLSDWINSLRSLIVDPFADGFEVVHQLLERFDENLTWPVD